MATEGFTGRRHGRQKPGLRLLLAAFVIALLPVVTSCENSRVDPASLRGGETRETLSPAYFTGRVARAYAAAKAIPEILDSLHCYCECKRDHGHKSLLTCHVDLHSADCDICIDEAIMAYELHKEGKDVVSIRKAVDRRFSRR